MAAKVGEVAFLPGKMDCPKTCDDPDRRVRAGLIRWLLLGGAEADFTTHLKGVMLRGAWIDGALDFQNCKTALDCKLAYCLFPEIPVFRDAELRGLYLQGSHATKGLDLHRLICKTNVHLNGGFQANGTVDLASARIGGQLACDGGSFDTPNGTALKCGSTVIGADVFLRDGFRAKGRIDFVRSQITGGLWVRNAALNGAFDGEAMTVGAGFSWQDVTGDHPEVDLRHAKVDVLHDDVGSWAGVKRLFLDGFRYDRVDSDMTVEHRRDLLALQDQTTQDNSRAFQPQPYTQMAAVLARAGNLADAARLCEMREAKTSRAALGHAWAGRGDRSWPLPAMIGPLCKRGTDAAFWAIFGYGHRPGRAWWWIGALVGLTALLFGHIYDLGQMAPNSAVVLTSADWLGALRLGETSGDPPLWHWVGSRGHAPMPSSVDYETFSRWLYAIDLFLPLDAIGQEQAWSPSHDRGVWGQAGFWLRLPIQLSGWLIVAVGGAIVTGLVGKKDD